MFRRSRLLVLLSLAMILAPVIPASEGARAAGVFGRHGNGYFESVWARSDLPVHEGLVNRTWMWGPEPVTGLMSEPYAEGHLGRRVVQYYDKSRMEINDPDADRSSPWFVTNGLLARELITGQMQVGDDEFESYQPSEVPVAGDPDSEFTPRYATLNGLLDQPPRPEGTTITEVAWVTGALFDEPALAEYGVTAGVYVPETDHTVASVFWEFMNSTGLVFQSSSPPADGIDPGTYSQDRFFENPFYATGFPITEAYWSETKVGGEVRDVLLQCFQRRCLTYTPGNSEGWRVEAANIGQHYLHWRYEEIGHRSEAPQPEETGDLRITAIQPGSSPRGDDEFIGMISYAVGPVDLAGWRVADEDGNQFVFQQSLVVYPGDGIAVWSCSKGDWRAAVHELSWGICDDVWGVSGGNAYLYDPQGRLIDDF